MNDMDHMLAADPMESMMSWINMEHTDMDDQGNVDTARLLADQNCAGAAVLRTHGASAMSGPSDELVLPDQDPGEHLNPCSEQVFLGSGVGSARVSNAAGWNSPFTYTPLEYYSTETSTSTQASTTDLPWLDFGLGIVDQWGRSQSNISVSTSHTTDNHRSDPVETHHQGPSANTRPIQTDDGSWVQYRFPPISGLNQSNPHNGESGSRSTLGPPLPQDPGLIAPQPQIMLPMGLRGDYPPPDASPSVSSGDAQSGSSARAFAAGLGHGRNRSISKMPLSDLYSRMGLANDHEEAKSREERIMNIVRREGFEVGHRTWIRDTDEDLRRRIIDELHRQTVRQYRYSKKTLEIIVRRGTYARMQSRLRQVRRHSKKAESISSTS